MNDSLYKQRAQAAVEMIVILAITLVILISIITLSQGVIGITKQDISDSMINSALGEIETSVEMVYAQGRGAKTQVDIELPNGVDRVNVSGKTFTFVMDNGEEKYRNFGFNVVGGFNPTQGTHKISIKAIESQTVQIGEEGVECSSDADCDDGDPCTTDTCNDPGTLNSSCYYSTITICTDDDGCCPDGCNESNDNDCPAVCGNGIVGGEEECDGDNLSGETCESLGYDGGSLSCSECSFNTSGCFNLGYWMTDAETGWGQGVFYNTTTDGNGNLILNSTSGGNLTETADSETVNIGTVDSGTVTDTQTDNGVTKGISEENIGTGGPNQNFQLEADEFFNTTASPSLVDELEITSNSWTNGENFAVYIYNYSSASYVYTGINISANTDGITYTATICSTGCSITDDPSNYINASGDMRLQYQDTLSNEGQAGSSSTLSIDYQAITLVGASSQYYTQGRYNSTLFNAGETVEWNNSILNTSTPIGTDYSISYAENSTGTWNYYNDITNVPDSQHLKFNTTLLGDSTTTPEINYVNITYREWG